MTATAVRRHRRLAGSLLCATVLAGLLAGCGGRDDDDIQAVRDAMARTGRLAKRIVYTEDAGDRSVQVQGIVEDDLRYKARLVLDGTPAYDEVVRDDSIAARMADPAAFDLFARPTSGRETTVQDDLDAVVSALLSRHWVVDPAGAPNLLAVANLDRTIGDDPIYDSLNVFRYIEEIVFRQHFVVEFDRFDYDYRPQEDPFPTPEDGSGVVRYDVRPLPLPKASDSAGGNQVVPGIANFRKMAIFVKDGLVIRVLEDIDVVSRLDEIERNYDIDLPDTMSVEEKVRVSIDAINAVRRGQGELAIRVRSMSIDLLDLGEDIAVELPTANVVEGSLALLAYRGKDDLRPGRRT